MKPLGILFGLAVLAMAGFGLYGYYSNPENIQQTQATATPMTEFAATPESQPGGNIQPTPTPAPVYIDGAGIWIWDEECPACWTDQWGNDTTQPRLWHDPAPVACYTLGPSDPEHPEWPPYCSGEALQLAVANGYATTNTIAQVPANSTPAPTAEIVMAQQDTPANPETPSEGWLVQFLKKASIPGILAVIAIAAPILGFIIALFKLTGKRHALVATVEEVPVVQRGLFGDKVTRVKMPTERLVPVRGIGDSRPPDGGPKDFDTSSKRWAALIFRLAIFGLVVWGLTQLLGR